MKFWSVVSEEEMIRTWLTDWQIDGRGKTHFTLRNFVAWDIKNIYSSVLKFALLQYIPFVNTHDCGINNVHNAIQIDLLILMGRKRKRNVKPLNSIINSKKQPGNLTNIMTRAKFQSANNLFSVKTSRDLRCGICSKEFYNYLVTEGIGAEIL